MKQHQSFQKFHQFTYEKYDVAVELITRKVKSLFKVNDRNLHPSCKIYKGECTCGETYVGETVTNEKVRWAEHSNINERSEPSKHLSLNVEHSFNRSLPQSALESTRTKKNLESFFIAKMKPSLHEQVESNALNLFRNGAT